MNDAAATPPDFITRLWFAWVCFFRVLLDPGFAGRTWAVRDSMPKLPPSEDQGLTVQPSTEAAAIDEVAARSPRHADSSAVDDARKSGLDDGRFQGALGILALLQRDGRFVDFVQQDVASFDDKDIGAAARVVHEGCRRALKDRIEIERVLPDAEGASIALPKNFDAHAIKLTGNVPSEASAVQGTVRHSGWRAKSVKLPEPTRGHVHEVLCPAEVEL